jgi:tRNA pseudouridine synthase 10
MPNVNEGDLINRALELLRRYPLCPSCLGRMFSSYLKGFTNYERGTSILTLLLMSLQEKIKNNDEEAKATLEKIKNVFPEIYKQSLDSLGVKWEGTSKCFVCGNLLSHLEELAVKGARVLWELKAESFVVGVSNDEEYVSREDEIWRAFSISDAESIRNELKREIGKRIQSISGIPVDFSNPGVILVVNLKEKTIDYVSSPILIKGVYLKLGRNISQSIWITPKKIKLVPLSVEEAANSCLDYLMASKVVIHAAGREDVDVRMLGSGRLLVLEIKRPQRRNIMISSLEHCLNTRSEWVKFRLEKKISREEARRIKLSDKIHRKIYRALIHSESGFSDEDAGLLEKKFNNVTVRQRTPTRVLRRRADIVRSKKVFWVKARVLGGKWMEVFIATEGGLYVKELVTGDNKRTTPSFSEAIAKPLLVAELDVVQIIDYPNMV